MKLQIRPYKPQDFRQLCAIWKAADIILDDTDTAKALRQNLRRDGYQVFVAESRTIDEHTHQFIGKPRLAGGVIVTFDGHRGYIYHFVVHRDFRGMGLGRALLETCERQAKFWGAQHLRLTSRVDSSRAVARKLYQSLGWIRDDSICAYDKKI
ncbi:MAG: GNAT family N-acetyltransferase [Planctomycetota bacterium]